MERIITKESHYGVDTWTHKEMDELRKTETLCRLCAKRKTGYCKNANMLFDVCKNGTGIAVIVTRCAEFQPDIQDC